MSGFGDFGTIDGLDFHVSELGDEPFRCNRCIDGARKADASGFVDCAAAFRRGFLVPAALYRRGGGRFSHGVGADADCAGDFYEYEN